jgi:hypothetical protein
MVLKLTAAPSLILTTDLLITEGYILGGGKYQAFTFSLDALNGIDISKGWSI